MVSYLYLHFLPSRPRRMHKMQTIAISDPVSVSRDFAVQSRVTRSDILEFSLFVALNLNVRLNITNVYFIVLLTVFLVR